MCKEPYGTLDPKVGFIYGSFSLMTDFFVCFFIPELSNRSLEEVDELFHTFQRFNYQCTGIGSHTTKVQNINADQSAHHKIIGLNLENSSEEHRDTIETQRSLQLPISNHSIRDNFLDLTCTQEIYQQSSTLDIYDFI